MYFNKLLRSNAAQQIASVADTAFIENPPYSLPSFAIILGGLYSVPNGSSMKGNVPKTGPLLANANSI